MIGKLPLHFASDLGVPKNIIQLLLDHYEGKAANMNGLHQVDLQG